MVSVLPTMFHTVRPCVAMRAVRIVCSARKANPNETTLKNIIAYFAGSSVRPIHCGIWPESG